MKTKLQDFKTAAIYGLSLGLVFLLVSIIMEILYPYNEYKDTDETPLPLNIYTIGIVGVYIVSSITFFRSIYKKRSIMFIKKIFLSFLISAISMCLVQVLAIAISPIFKFPETEQKMGITTIIIIFGILFFIPSLFFWKASKMNDDVLDL
mgnify:CR=1 FL=1